MNERKLRNNGESFFNNASNEEEERKKLINQNGEINNNKGNQVKQKEWIYVDPSIYFIYFLLNGVSFILGSILKLIKPISRNTIGKNSILTGIPLLRKYFFLFPISMSVIYFIWCVWKYYTNSSMRAQHERNIFKYLKNIRGAFLFTNLIILVSFYLLYNGIYHSIYKYYGFRLSGHILASILSGGMMANLHHTYQPFIELKIDPKFNLYFSYVNIFLYYHSIYTIFWTAWIFHRITELVISFIISMGTLIVIHVANVDCFLLNLIDCNMAKKNRVILFHQ